MLVTASRSSRWLSFSTMMSFMYWSCCIQVAARTFTNRVPLRILSGRALRATAGPTASSQTCQTA